MSAFEQLVNWEVCPLSECSLSEVSLQLTCTAPSTVTPGKQPRHYQRLPHTGALHAQIWGQGCVLVGAGQRGVGLDVCPAPPL